MSEMLSTTYTGSQAGQPPPPAVGAQFGVYTLESVLGRGGMGIVYLATHTFLKREVALKLLLNPGTGHSATQVDRFILEARHTAALSHPNIVSVHTAGMHDGLPFIEMERIEGRPLSECLPPGGMQERQALGYTLEVAQALSHAHAAGIVHRDIKPSNILLAHDGRIKVVDFGLAFSTEQDERLTRSNSTVGTLLYMAPEQCRGEEAEPTTDLYALGATLYHLLTGAPPFRGSPPEVVYQHLSAPAPLITDKRPEVSEGTERLVQRLLQKSPQRRYTSAGELVSALERALELGPRSRPSAEANPYRGLESFQAEHQALFFGRDSLIDTCIDSISRRRGPEGGAQLLVVLGPSGSGKSSLVRAGLVPALTRRDDDQTLTPEPSDDDFDPDTLSQPPALLPLIMTPGAHPLEELAIQLAQLVEGDRLAISKASEIGAALTTRGHGGRATGLRQVVAMLAAELRGPLVLVVDQLEEAFSQCADPNERALFVDLLLEATDGSTTDLFVICTLRSDFLAFSQELPRLSQAIAHNSVIVPALSDDDLRQIITRPAALAGHALDSATVELLLEQMRGSEGSLPLLQFTLARIWEGLARSESAAEVLKRLGGVGGAVAGEAEAVFKALNDADKALARRCFERLVHLDDDGKATRRKVQLRDLSGPDETLFQMRALLRRFALPTGRILTLSADHGGVERVQVTHEAIFAQWQTLKTWLVEGREDIRFARLVDAAAAEWSDGDRAVGLLWGPPRLNKLEDWVGRNPGRLTCAQLAFADACTQRHEQLAIEQAARAQAEVEAAAALAQANLRSAETSRRALWVTVALLLVASALAVWATLSKQEALRSLEVADAATEEALLNQLELKAQATLGSQPIEAIGYAYEALRRRMGGATAHGPTAQMTALLTDALAADLQQWRTPGRQMNFMGYPTADEGNSLVDPLGAFVLNGDFPAGQLVLTALSDGSSSAPIFQCPDHPTSFMAGLDAAAWSPDGQRIAVFDHHELAQGSRVVGMGALLTRAGTQIGSFTMADELMTDLAWSPDGRLLAAGTLRLTHKHGDQDGALWLVNAEGDPLWRSPHAAPLASVRFSPDGRHVLAASRSQGCLLWRVDGGATDPPVDAPTPTRIGGAAPMRACKWSPDGAQILSHTDDGRLWLHTAEGALLFERTDPQWGVVDADFSPDGEALAALNVKGLLVLLDLQGSVVSASDAHTRGMGVEWSPDGSRLLTYGEDGLVRIWSDKGSPLGAGRGHRGYVKLAAWLPDGSGIVSLGVDGTLRRWAPDQRLYTHLGAQDFRQVLSLAWSPDGGTLSMGKHGGDLRQSTPSGEAAPAPLSGHTKAVTHLSYAPDTGLLLSASADNNAHIWAADGQLQRSLIGHSGGLFYAEWGPGGQVVTASDDNTARIWSPDGLSIHALQHDMSVRYATWSPDGTRVATACDDGVARIWSASDGSLRATLDAHTAVVRSVSWSPDGERLATASRDGTVAIWSAAGALVAQTPSHGANSIVRWARWSPDGASLLAVTVNGGSALWTRDGELVAWLKPHAGADAAPLERPEHLVEGDPADTMWVGAFSPNGAYVAIAGMGKQLQVYDRRGRLVFMSPQHATLIASLAWSPDSSQVACGTADGTTVITSVNLDDLMRVAQQRLAAASP